MERTGGASSSVIVPTPSESETVALTGPLRLTVKVSLSSSRRSDATMTVMLLASSPGAKVRVPLLAV